MDSILILLGLGALIVALWGLVRGRVAWAHIGDRKRSAQVAAGGLVAMVVGSAMAPQSSVAVPASQPLPEPTVTVTVTAAPVTVTVTPAPVTVLVTPTPTPTPEPEPQPEPAPTQITGFVGNGGAATQPPATKAPAPKATKAPAPKAVYYKNCTAARAAGAAPIRRGEPGYASHLDRDNDGIACE
ncbi:excalibur calcium-binding domain-containing protein [Propioniciclava sp. MC1683]|uniref:excalibur calcium-binding domain-containing protein n=1 Tax=Propioniciclava sp. MC1683 TaxID=2760309 RepID=UPI001C71E0B9|nr:excalibur calcium-binding domain-containing protein [Propioniciclava sp. MC1683]